MSNPKNGMCPLVLLKKVLIKYFTEMQQQGKIRECNIESAALQFISMNFGFVILDVSFGKSLMGITKEEYIKYMDSFIKTETYS